MTTHEKAVEAAAMAIRSDIWEREPNPTTERYVADLRQQAKDQAGAAIAAYISALLPEDSQGLVEPLSMSMFISPSDMIARLLSDREQAASLIQSQAAGWAADKARIAALEAGLEAAAQTMRNSRGAIESNQVEDNDVWRQLARGIEAARALLNGERKGTVPVRSPFSVLTDELDGEKAISAIEALNRAGWIITRTGGQE